MNRLLLIILLNLAASCSPYQDLYRACRKSKKQSEIIRYMEFAIIPECEKQYQRGTYECWDCVRRGTKYLMLNIKADNEQGMRTRPPYE